MKSGSVRLRRRKSTRGGVTACAASGIPDDAPAVMIASDRPDWRHEYLSELARREHLLVVRSETGISVSNLPLRSGILISIADPEGWAALTDSVLDAMPTGGLLVDLTPVSPRAKEKMGAAAARKSVGMVDGALHRDADGSVVWLLSGAAAPRVADALWERAVRAEVVGHDCGDASRAIAVRDDFLAKLANLVADSLVSARYSGAESWCAAQLAVDLAAAAQPLARSGAALTDQHDPD